MHHSRTYHWAFHEPHQDVLLRLVLCERCLGIKLLEAVVDLVYVHHHHAQGKQRLARSLVLAFDQRLCDLAVGVCTHLRHDEPLETDHAELAVVAQELAVLRQQLEVLRRQMQVGAAGVEVVALAEALVEFGEIDGLMYTHTHTHAHINTYMHTRVHPSIHPTSLSSRSMRQ